MYMYMYIYMHAHTTWNLVCRQTDDFLTPGEPCTPAGWVEVVRERVR